MTTPQHRVPHNVKWTSFAPPGWTNFAPPLTGDLAAFRFSREQVPVLMAADRSGTTVSAVLPRVDAAALTAALDPVVAKLVSDTHLAPPRSG